MSVEIRVPQLPESVTDARLTAWRKQAGEAVSRDESLADLETDKVVLDVPAPISGIIKEIRAQAGATVHSGDLLAILEEGAAAAASAPAPASAVPTASVASPAAAAGNGSTSTETGTPRTSPAARRVLEENQLPPAAVKGNGPGGRITKADAEAAVATKRAAAPPGAAATAKPTAALAAPRAGRVDQRVPMTRLRARIAERLLQAQSSQALLTTFNEVDLGAVQDLRARHKDLFEKKHSVKLGFMSFFVKAVIEGLKRFPVVNASVEDADIVYHEYFDVGVAVSTDRGLVVPVLRDADALSFAGIEQRIGEFAARARAGAITLEDLTGGTFSITNGGIFGSLMSTPIVNTPQSAILGMHKIQERPMVVNGQVVVRPMMYLALTYDHRIIDGREAVQFLVAVKDCLEDPGRLLLGV
jgi:2-oxoglutarate dehydrogenase E2 component (dihydrolipoamide succinyltransferase)